MEAVLLFMEAMVLVMEAMVLCKVVLCAVMVLFMEAVLTCARARQAGSIVNACDFEPSGWKEAGAPPPAAESNAGRRAPGTKRTGRALICV
eukprot:3105028-Rhodomonas_salina.2